MLKHGRMGNVAAVAALVAVAMAVTCMLNFRAAPQAPWLGMRVEGPDGAPVSRARYHFDGAEIEVDGRKENVSYTDERLTNDVLGVSAVTSVLTAFAGAYALIAAIGIVASRRSGITHTPYAFMLLAALLFSLTAMLVYGFGMPRAVDRNASVRPAAPVDTSPPGASVWGERTSGGFTVIYAPGIGFYMGIGTLAMVAIATVAAFAPLLQARRNRKSN